MASKIQLVPRGDGTYAEPGTDVTWVEDSYTEPRETEFECVVCERPIEDWDLYTCLDGGDAAHVSCVEVQR